MTKADRQRLRELADRATPGPWRELERCPNAEPDRACGVTSEQLHRSGRDRVCVFASDAYDECSHPVSRADAAFVAAARTAVPELLDELERLRAALAEALRMAEHDLPETGTELVHKLRRIAELRRLTEPKGES